MGDDVIENSTDIDAEVFKQILDMDDGDEEKEFSRTIVFDFFSQAEEKIEEMKVNLQQKNLDGLSSLGHFLKGSSATLGFTKIKDACEAIQHLGNGLDEHGQRMVTDPKDSLDRIQKKVDVMEVDCKLLRKILRRYYSMDPFWMRSVGRSVFPFYWWPGSNWGLYTFRSIKGCGSYCKCLCFRMISPSFGL